MVIKEAIFGIQEEEQCLPFPKHFYAHFAEHMLKLLKPSLNNIDLPQRLGQISLNNTLSPERKKTKILTG